MYLDDVIHRINQGTYSHKDVDYLLKQLEDRSKRIERLVHAVTNPPVMLKTDKGNIVSEDAYNNVLKFYKDMRAKGLWSRIKWAFKPRA